MFGVGTKKAVSRIRPTAFSALTRCGMSEQVAPNIARLAADASDRHKKIPVMAERQSKDHDGEGGQGTTGKPAKSMTPRPLAKARRRTATNPEKPRNRPRKYITRNLAFFKRKNGLARQYLFSRTRPFGALIALPCESAPSRKRRLGIGCTPWLKGATTIARGFGLSRSRGIFFGAGVAKLVWACILS